MKQITDSIFAAFSELFRSRELRQRAARSMVISVACVFVLLLVNRVLLPNYRQIFARDLTLEIIATGEKNEESLYHNVRLSGIVCNGTRTNLSQIPLDGNWEYSESDDFLYNYHSYDPNRIVLVMKNVISVDLTFVSERGSGFVQLIANGKELAPVDLYSDETWSYKTVRYDTSPLVHPEQHPAVVLLLLLAVFTLVWCCTVRFGHERMEPIAAAGTSVLLQGLLALVLMLSCIFIQYQNPAAAEDYRSASYLVHLEGYMLIFLPMFLLYSLTRSHWLSFGLMAAVLEIIHLVSGIKASARGTPLLPWDFQIAGAALSVAGGYDLSLSAMSIVTLLCSAVIVVSLFVCRSCFRKIRWPASILSGGICGAVLVLFLQTTVFCGLWNNPSSSRVYQVSDYYADNGFVVAFTEFISYLKPQGPPEGYSAQTMQQLAEQIQEEAPEQQPESAAPAELPNIIAIMSESFWDITMLENVTFDTDPLPVYRALTQECMYGNLLSHVFGGNTVVSEFEFLTGFHGSFFPSDYMVYGSCLGDEFASAASVLRDQGYHTVAIHPYEATNYNRNTAYQVLGFEQMLFEDDFPADSERIRNYISDKAMYQQIAQQYEQLQAQSDAPLFLFGITMQNHGGYWPETIYEPSRVSFSASGYQDSTLACMDDYFAGLRTSDEALGMLIQYFETVEEDTIVIYFGDHMSDAGTKTEKMFAQQSWYQSSTFDVDVRSHTVPYLVWSNCGIEPGEQQIMDISMLLPSVLEQTRVRIPAFWRYLLENRYLCRAFNSAVVVEADLSGRSRTELAEDTQAYLDTYQMLMYDYVWGKRYADDLWHLSKAD